MSEKRELNVEELEKVSGGAGAKINYDEIESIPIGSEILYLYNEYYKVILKRVDLANDSVYVTPSGQESNDFFVSHTHGFSMFNFKPIPITAESDGTYRIVYNRSNTVKFYRL